MARPVSVLEVTDSERAELEWRLQAPTTAVRDHLRARIILRRVAGLSQEQVAAELGASKATRKPLRGSADAGGGAG